MTEYYFYIEYSHWRNHSKAVCKLNALTVDFRSLIPMAGGTIEGARVLFERLIVALMRKIHRDVANIRPKRGDWGIDCFGGNLSGGSVVVWQAKYFLDGLGDTQKDEIRDSFKSLMEAAGANNFKVTAWTLCLPCQLSADERQWWDGWKKRQKATGVKITLRDEDGLRELLFMKDCEDILSGTFGDNPTWIKYFVSLLEGGLSEREIHDLPDPEPYEDAVFVKQLRAALVTEVRGAKTAFFNAELLTQEVYDKGDQREIQELRSLTNKILVLWEVRFNPYLWDQTIEPVKFYADVMQAVELQSTTNLRSKLTQASGVHKQGIGHQLADRCQIGWVRNFRTRFEPVRSETA